MLKVVEKWDARDAGEELLRLDARHGRVKRCHRSENKFGRAAAAAGGHAICAFSTPEAGFALTAGASHTSLTGVPSSVSQVRHDVYA